MLKRITIWLSAALVALSLALASSVSAEAKKTIYWISHGSPADPVWTYFLAGAKQWAEDTGNTVNTSFHNGDVPAHQEAVRAAIAAKADGIVTTSPDPGSLIAVARRRMMPASQSSTSTRPIPKRASMPMSAATTSLSASTGRNIWSTRAW
jgi:simple sugar transport system substrate-binding protein